MLLECKLHVYRSVSANMCGTKVWICGTHIIRQAGRPPPLPPHTHTHKHKHTQTVLVKLTGLMYCTCDVTLSLVRVTIADVVKQ